MKLRVFVILVAVSLLSIGCATVPMTGRSQLALVPEADMVTAASQNYDEFLGTVKVSDDPAANALVGRIGERVAASAEKFLTDLDMTSDLRFYDWRFTVVDDDETVNAFCMPGGKIVVYSGIIPVAETEDQQGGIQIDTAGPRCAHGQRNGFDDLIELFHSLVPVNIFLEFSRYINDSISKSDVQSKVI